MPLNRVPDGSHCTLAVGDEVFCSTVIATINRPTLTAAVRSVLDQQFDEDDFEVIVVNDTGQPLPDYDWKQSERVTVVTTQKRERSVARNTGASLAKGRYLHFLDGDDVLVQGALSAFWNLSQESEAEWLYGGYRSLDRDGKTIADHRPTASGDMFAASVAGELIPLQASLLSAQRYHEVGGFDPTFVIVEDYDLARRFSFEGHIAGTAECVALIKTGRAGSTGDWSAFSRQEARSREKILSMPTVVTRLERSLRGLTYWRGRIARIYLASSMYNLRSRRLFVALDRLVAMALLSRQYVLSPVFWQGLRRRVRVDPAEYRPASVQS